LLSAGQGYLNNLCRILNFNGQQLKVILQHIDDCLIRTIFAVGDFNTFQRHQKFVKLLQPRGHRRC
ncbi:hypothetical protein Bhyg_12299, partial [Pseudolycoriella hygida]